MRKLLLVVLIVASLAVWAIAADVSIGVSGKAKFSLTFGSSGGDISGTFTDGPNWSYSVSVDGLSLSLSGVGADVTLSSISAENEKFGFKFGSFNPSTNADAGGLGWTNYIFYNLSDTALLLNFKEFNLDVSYVDISNPDPTKTYLDDALAVYYTTDVLAVAGDVIFGEKTGFGAELKFTGVDKLTVIGGYGSDGVNSGYAAYAEYGALEVGPLSLTAWVEYTSGLASLTYSSGSDSQAVGATVELSVDPLTATAKPKYDLIAGAFTLYAKLAAEGSVDPLSYEASIEWPDLVSDTMLATATAKLTLSPELGIEQLANPSLEFSLTYGLKTGYYEWSVSVTSALYELLDLAFSLSGAKDADTSWSVTLSKEIAF